MNSLRILCRAKGPSPSASRSFHSTPVVAETAKQRAARKKKAQNISKRAVIDAQSRAAKPHPVLGLSEENMSKWERTKLYKTLVNVEQLNKPIPPPEPPKTSQSESDGPAISPTSPPELLNFGLSPTTASHLLNSVPEVALNLVKAAEAVRRPEIPKVDPTISRAFDGPRAFNNYALANVLTTAVTRSAKAQSEAMARIIDLRNASARGISFENRRRIVEAFQRPAAGGAERSGPDTGSAEVQAALITAKIRNIWDHLKRPGNSRDLHTQRALTMLVHQRAKVLKYLKRTDVVRYDQLLLDIGVERGAVEGEIVVR